MRTAKAGDRIEVAVNEIFGLVRAGRETSGYKFGAEVPDGVVRLSAERGASSGTGGAPSVIERFYCTKPGSYEIRLSEGRPWERNPKLDHLYVLAH